MTEELKQEAPAQEAAPATDAPQSPDLNINDLNALKSIIDVATQRGAFKAGEMEAVGKVYNRLNTFLDSVTKKE
jgi:3-oxoacyl-ACP reductase-like protein